MKRGRFSKIVFIILLLGGAISAGIVYSQQGEQIPAPPEPAKEEKPAEEAKAQTPQIVTDCFESRLPQEDGKSYTKVTRVENTVQQYGWPNVKCSQTTGGVLWWGDPFDGTAPMGDMPVLANDDYSKGDYAKEEAVVKPRQSQLMYFNLDPNKNCALCHDGKIVPFPKDKKPRKLAAHQDVVADSMQLMHGRAAFWCLDCHNHTSRKTNALIDHWGNEISFNQPQKLCGKCHGEVYIDWRLGIHGKRIGSWVSGGKKRWWVCTECHNPHTVQVNRFQPIKPETAPVLPKGMKNANHEQSQHDDGHDTTPKGAAGH
ncbi:MAG: hypothetical protein A2073_08725 [Deltaproteobacteria bacterium GWC2_42_11]|nr:MAG: hypothetical protein A2073_08725 [Deltaproteobacteria bacterium GWC2_42_11]HBO84353.1 hypothetical protein [Deltaproteobacteria bacterium]